MSVHCWQSRNDFLYDTDLNAYAEIVARHYEEPGPTPDATCLLAADHAGPHEWTSDDAFRIHFHDDQGRNRAYVDGAPVGGAIGGLIAAVAIIALVIGAGLIVGKVYDWLLS